MPRFLLLFTAVAAIAGLGGCATILNDPHQMVAFSTDPDGATVYVDGVAMGKTPVVIPVPRKGGDKQLEFRKPGYKTVMMKLDNTLSAALAGNILFGGLIGLGVDAVSGRGGGYQDSVHVILEQGQGIVDVSPRQQEPPNSDLGYDGPTT